MNDLVSIITPTFNRAYILKNPIESVLTQTYAHWEMIIVDDGSTDDTKTLVESFNDPRIRYVWQENKGQSVARNHGLEMAKGKWITFIDSDNDFVPMFLERALHVLDQHPDKRCLIPRGMRWKELYENGKLLQKHESPSFPEPDVENVAKELFMRSFIFDLNAFIHTSSIRDENIRFDERMRRNEDWDYAMTIAEKHPHDFIYLDEILYNYHQRWGTDGLVSNTSYIEWADGFEYVYRKHEKDTLMQGQTWYPKRVLKWRKIQADYEKGIEPPPHLYRFKK